MVDVLAAAVMILRLALGALARFVFPIAALAVGWWGVSHNNPNLLMYALMLAVLCHAFQSGNQER